MPNVQYEAAWCITNIATGTREQVQCLVSKGVVPRLIALMSSGSDNLIDQAIWALGNIAGDNSECCNLVLECGMVPALVKLLKKTKNFEILKNSCWAISNLTRGGAKTKYSNLKELVPIICEITRKNEDKGMLGECCWVLTSLAEMAPNKMEIFANNDILPRLVQLLS